ncbi:MAG TPA: MraY family glycosyltransferase [Gammaproteobacteria bacterium]|nr:MraY family glycosyltransferase [Gammaproteobacteria bacterium]
MIYLLAFVCTLGLVGALVPVAHFAGLMDHPRDHKIHIRPTPVVGGLAMALSCIAFFGWPGGPIGQMPEAYIWSSLLLLLQGMIDDRRSLSAGARFVGQLTAASIVVFAGGVQVHSLGDLLGFGAINLGWAAGPFTLFAIVGFINAFNMIDGADGLAGSMILTIGALLLGASWWSGYTALVPEIAVLIASAAGFLAWNLRVPGRTQARVFLGDAGSTWAGFTLACLTILITQRSQGVLSPMVAIWILAVPVFDSVSLMLQRWGNGRSPFSADNEHLHHLLVGRGLSVNAVVGVTVCLASLLGLVGLWLDGLRVPEVVSALLGLAVFMVYHRTTRRLVRDPEWSV